MQDWLKSVQDDLISIRKKLHRNPEVALNEKKTCALICAFLEDKTNAFVQTVAETGVLAHFDFGHEGPTILIRGDIDALPIQEVNTFEHRSATDGVSHKCGHDGHTTMLLGLAHALSEFPLERGQVVLLFQPAEENGKGARAVLDSKEFKKYRFDFVFALHNLPGYARNSIVVKEGPFTANVQSIIVKLNGKTSHAAEPELGKNPARCIANILTYADEHTNNHPDQDDFLLLTPVYATLGDQAYGISAGYGEAHLTIRSWSPEIMDQKCAALVDFIEGESKSFGLGCDISWTEVFRANINDRQATQMVRNAAVTCSASLEERPYPFKWGEDFGLLTQVFPGAMFGLGAGEDTPALHNPDYDFPDEIIPTGISMFYQILKEAQDIK